MCDTVTLMIFSYLAFIKLIFLNFTKTFCTGFVNNVARPETPVSDITQNINL